MEFEDEIKERNGWIDNVIYGRDKSVVWLDNRRLLCTEILLSQTMGTGKLTGQFLWKKTLEIWSAISSIYLVAYGFQREQEFLHFSSFQLPMLLKKFCEENKAIVHGIPSTYVDTL